MGAAQPIVGRHGIRLNGTSMSAMPDDDLRQSTSRFQVRATAESHFSWLRTRMSTERTLMSWVRTATALIGFGFTIFQFLHRFNETPGVKPAAEPWTPWVLGLSLIGTGIVALTIAVWEYRLLIRYLWETDFKPIAGIDESAHHTPIVAVSVVLILIGIFAFGAVLLRVP
jgi:putative membrane protein